MTKGKIIISGNREKGTTIDHSDLEILKAFANLLTSRGYDCSVECFIIPGTPTKCPVVEIPGKGGRTRYFVHTSTHKPT